MTSYPSQSSYDSVEIFIEERTLRPRVMMRPYNLVSCAFVLLLVCLIQLSLVQLCLGTKEAEGGSNCWWSDRLFECRLFRAIYRNSISHVRSRTSDVSETRKAMFFDTLWIKVTCCSSESDRNDFNRGIVMYRMCVHNDKFKPWGATRFSRNLQNWNKYVLWPSILLSFDFYPYGYFW